MITIEIETKFKKCQLDSDDNDDVTMEVEKEFHDSIFRIIEEKLQSDDFEQEWLDFVGELEEYEYIPNENYDEFSDYGSVSIKIGVKQ
jgi:hypothetical protein